MPFVLQVIKLILAFFKIVLCIKRGTVILASLCSFIVRKKYDLNFHGREL